MSTSAKKKLVSKDAPSVGAGIGRNPECNIQTWDDAPEEKEDEVDDIRAFVRNHTSSWLVRWTWLTGIAMFTLEMLGVFVYMLFHFSANYVFPGMVGAERRALVIGAVVFMVKITVGRWTSAHLDPVRSIASCVTFILTRGRKMKGGAVWMELIKLPIFIIAQWLGVMLALAFLGLWTGTDIKTSDCSILPTPAVCDIYPVKDAGVSVSSLDWIEVMGALMIYGSFVWGERFFAWHYPNILFSALFYGAGHYLVHLLWSTASGGSFNFWYWSMTAWFSDISDPNKGSYIWPLMVGTFIGMVIDIVVYYIIERGIKRSSSDSESYKML